jgi:4-hydroxythreonine-4-phosphate dehydrogenase
MWRARSVALITPERIDRVIGVTDRVAEEGSASRDRRFVSGLNPHAGEDGLFGSKKSNHLPAIERAGERDRGASGPFGADTMFRR